MAVNEPSPRAKPKDKVCLRCHKSLATRVITVIIISHLIGPDSGVHDESIVTVTENKSGKKRIENKMDGLLFNTLLCLALA